MQMCKMFMQSSCAQSCRHPGVMLTMSKLKPHCNQHPEHTTRDVLCRKAKPWSTMCWASCAKLCPSRWGQTVSTLGPNCVHPGAKLCPPWGHIVSTLGTNCVHHEAKLRVHVSGPPVAPRSTLAPHACSACINVVCAPAMANQLLNYPDAATSDVHCHPSGHGYDGHTLGPTHGRMSTVSVTSFH
jgi:hypothetical protein